MCEWRVCAPVRAGLDRDLSFLCGSRGLMSRRTWMAVGCVAAAAALASGFALTRGAEVQPGGAPAPAVASPAAD